MRSTVLSIILSVLPLLAYLQENVSAQDIISKINKGEEVYYENATITGDLDFRYVEDVEKEGDREFFGNRDLTIKYHVNSDLKFVNCEFQGEVIGYWHNDKNDELHIAHFHGDVYF